MIWGWILPCPLVTVVPEKEGGPVRGTLFIREVNIFENPFVLPHHPHRPLQPLLHVPCRGKPFSPSA